MNLRDKTANCGNCFFMVRDKGYLKCHFNPPRKHNLWPEVNSLDFCSKWASKDGTINRPKQNRD